MLSIKPTSGFRVVLGSNFAVIALTLLMTVTISAFGAGNSSFAVSDTAAGFFGLPSDFTGVLSNLETAQRIQPSKAEPQLMVTPTLGDYPNTSIYLSTNDKVIPSSTPTNAARINVSTDTSFKGTLAGDPVTGEVWVTDAHPAGSYTVTVRAFDSGGTSATKTFTLTVTTPSACPVSFASPATHTTGGGPFSVAIGDFNQDGKQDLATANDKTYNISILLGNGSGGFGTATDYDVGELVNSSIAVGDFNGDGKQDLVVGAWDRLSLLLGNGDGTFGTAVDFTSVIAEFVAVGDFNGDGKQDVVTTDQGADSVSILLGNGAGSFGSPTEIDVDDAPMSVAVADFNNDGDQDLVTTNFVGTISILLGNGDGSFGSASNYYSYSGQRGMAVGDLDADGNQDVATVNDVFPTVQILLGDGEGGFGSPTQYATDGTPLTVAIGDFDANGKADLAIATDVTNSLHILLGDSFVPFASLGFPINNFPITLAVGDFNGDGKQDFVAGNTGESTNVSVLVRNCSSVSGTVTYGNAIGSPTPRYVSNVLMTASGSTTPSATTDFPNGTYTLTGIGPGSLTVTPSKGYNTAINGSITSNDAAKITQHVTGGPFLSGNQLIVADVSGNGVISSFDAGLVSKYVINSPTWGLTATWKFVPTSKTYSSGVNSVITGEDYVALLMGEVSGNWANSNSRPARATGPERPMEVLLPELISSPDKEIVLPVEVRGAANKEIISYEFDLRYDPAVVQPAADLVSLTKTVSHHLTVVTNSKQRGVLRVVVYGPFPINEDGVLLNLKFLAVGGPGSVSPLNWERIMFNEGEPIVNTIDGQIEVF